MVIKLSVVFVAFAAIANAALTKRVACPDGVNTASHEAVSLLQLFMFEDTGNGPQSSVVLSSPSETTYRTISSIQNAVKMLMSPSASLSMTRSAFLRAARCKGVALTGR